MRIKNEKDFWSGVMFALLGLFFVVVAQENKLGTAARMGPAYFPTLLGGLLVVLGIIIALIGLKRKGESGDGKVEAFNWTMLTMILGAVFLFTLLLKPMGLMLSLAAMIVVALLAEKKLYLKETLALIIVLDVFAWVVFVYGIGMIVPVWPTFSF